jgi:serine/threonine-protein kinase
VVQIGSVLGGRYKLIDKLGSGGMGTVWVAENTALGGDATVAVKVLHAQFATDATAVERFKNEARIAAKLGHPHIVRVYDFGEDDEGAPYIVMERLLGESLAARLEHEGHLAPREAVEVLLDVLEALAAAHDRDILHRDLKPENVFLAREGSKVVPKILDFGVSKILGSDENRVKMTRTGSLIGTPAYMSPELLLGGATDLRSDLWAMGVMLYELLSGRLPYESDNYNAVLVRIATGHPTPLRDHVPDLDSGLVTIVERAMARKPSARFASARVMRDALSAWLASGVSSERPQVVPRSTTAPQATPMAFEHAETMPGDSQVSPRARRSAPGLALGVGLGVVAAVGLFAFTQKRPRDERPATQSVRVTSVGARPMLSVRDLPRGAHIEIDDEPTMLPAPMTPDAVHHVKVSAAGYTDWEGTVAYPRGDVELTYAGRALTPETSADAQTVTTPTVPTRAVVRHGTRTTTPTPGGTNPNGLLVRTPGF